FVVFAGVGGDDEEFNGIAGAEAGGAGVETHGFVFAIGQQAGEDEVVGVVFELFYILLVGLLGGDGGRVWLLGRFVRQRDWRTEQESNHEDSKTPRATRFFEPIETAAFLNFVFENVGSRIAR